MADEIIPGIPVLPVGGRLLAVHLKGIVLWCIRVAFCWKGGQLPSVCVTIRAWEMRDG